MGMEIEAQDGPSTYLRGWGDYQRWSLKLTASDTCGMGVLGLRAWSPEALERRVAAVEATGLGERLDRRRPRPRPVLPLPRPRRPPLRALLRVRALRAPAPSAPALKNVPGRYTGRGCAVKRLDHVNILAADVRANREFCVDALGYRLYERIELDDGSEAGAWMSATIAAHELIYTRDALRRSTAGCTTSRSGSTRARSACAPPTSGSTPGIEIEAAPSKHAIAQGFFLYGIEPGGNRVEVTTGGRFVYDPDEPCVVWTEEERGKGQAWGVKTVESFHTYGTPPA